MCVRFPIFFYTTWPISFFSNKKLLRHLRVVTLYPMALWSCNIFLFHPYNTPWKMNGWNLQPSPIFLKRNMIFQTSMILFHVDLQGCLFGVVWLFLLKNLLGQWNVWSLTVVVETVISFSGQRHFSKVSGVWISTHSSWVEIKAGSRPRGGGDFEFFFSHKKITPPFFGGNFGWKDLFRYMIGASLKEVHNIVNIWYVLLQKRMINS